MDERRLLYSRLRKRGDKAWLTFYGKRWRAQLVMYGNKYSVMAIESSERPTASFRHRNKLVYEGQSLKDALKRVAAYTGVWEIPNWLSSKLRGE